MNLAAGDLEALWNRLRSAGRGARRFVTLRIDGAEPLDAHAALRTADESPCLLFELSPGTATRNLEFEAGGMRCARSALEDGLCLVLSLEDDDKRDLFGTLCADVLVYAASEHATGWMEAVILRLEAWRAFLRSTGGNMTRSETIGLMGELHVLKALLEKKPSLLDTWRAPDDAIHDFEHLGLALEVKTTLGPGSRITIANLDQLDDAGLERLSLVHVRLYETPDGECLDDLTAAISSALSDAKSRRWFSSALLRRGLSPDDQRARAGIRAGVKQVHVHPVTQGFPRVLRGDVSSAIVDASYVIELSHFRSTAEPWAAVLDSFSTRRQ